MNHPKLRFQLNPDLDINMCQQLLNHRQGGVDFGARIHQLHPQLDANSIPEYVTQFYKENNQVLQQALETCKNEWEKDEDAFFELVDKLFLHHPGPPGDYICFLSIFDINPYFIENCSFQVHYRHHLGFSHVIAHELLHFIFHYYFRLNLTDTYHSLSKHQLWQISEIFNDIVLVYLPEFSQFKPKSDSTYPELVPLITKIKSGLDLSNFSVKAFFDSALGHLVQ